MSTNTRAGLLALGLVGLGGHGPTEASAAKRGGKQDDGMTLEEAVASLRAGGDDPWAVSVVEAEIARLRQENAELKASAVTASDDPTRWVRGPLNA